jgi:elongation factor Ts
MATVTAALVKELRERTGAGMMECKKALVASKGDVEAAIEEMRKSGQAKADKKASRVAAEGIIQVQVNAGNATALMLEVNCETDFVARDENFVQFADTVAQAAAASDVNDVAALAQLSLPALQLTVEEARQQLVAKIGENIQIRRLQRLKFTDLVGTYIHGGRIGVVVELTGGDEDLAKDIAMHIAASNPLVVAREDVPAEVVSREREIFTAQAKESGKPDEIIEKMIEGRINKFLDEVSLLGQPFVKDPSTKVGNLLKAKNAEVKSFLRLVVGEGITKAEDNFVDEVMSHVKEAQ